MRIMNENPTARGGDWKGLSALFALFFLASSGFFQRNMGLPGVAVYAVFLCVAGSVWWRFRGTLHGWIEKRFALWMSLFAFGLLVLFIVGHPIEDSQGVGRSSDRDEGLNAAVTRLLGGEYPYYPPRDDAGPLSVFPGAIFLAVPFVLIGDSAYQNLFWLAVLCWLGVRTSSRRSEFLLVLGTAFALSPALQYEFISGGDMLSNGIYIALALGFFLRSWTFENSNLAPRIAAAVFLGIALASRPNLLLLLPLVGGAVWRWAGFPRAISGCGIAVGIFAAVSLPFILINPEGFTPFSAGNKLALIDRHIPWASVSLHALSALSATAAGLWIILGRGRADERPVLGLAAWVTATPMLGAVAFHSVISGAPDFGFMHPRYGLMYLFFCLGAWGLSRDNGFRLLPYVPRVR